MDLIVNGDVIGVEVVVANVVVVKRDIVDVGLDRHRLAGVVGDIALGGFDGLCLAAEGAHHQPFLITQNS